MTRSSWFVALCITVVASSACAAIAVLAAMFPLHVIYLSAFGVIYGAMLIGTVACVLGGALAIGGLHRLLRRAMTRPALPRAVALPRRPRAMIAA